jgi:UDP-N-acetyl-D-glucosamine dehydrogenase
MARDVDLLARIESHEAVIGIIGLGYVGLPLAVAFAEAGFRTVGFDVKPQVVEGLNEGRSHITDITSERLAALVGDGKPFEATLDFERLEEADAVVICVPTPLSKTDDPDLSFVVAAAEAVRSIRRRRGRGRAIDAAPRSAGRARIHDLPGNDPRNRAADAGGDGSRCRS